MIRAVLIILTLFMVSMESWSALLIFRNGDFKYGVVQKVQGGYRLTDDQGKLWIYKDVQVREYAPLISKPGSGTIVQATDFIHEATSAIWSITEELTVPLKIETDDERDFFIDVEKGFEIPKLKLYSTSFPFFNRQGSFLSAIIVNSSTKAVYGIEFRIYVYNQEDKLMITKDFYANRLPPTSPAGKKFGRKFSVSLPDVPLKSIKRMRVVRKF